MIMIVVKCKLQEQLQYKDHMKMYQIDVSASICSNFDITVTSSVYIPHLQLIIYKSYANHIS